MGNTIRIDTPFKGRYDISKEGTKSTLLRRIDLEGYTIEELREELKLVAGYNLPKWTKELKQEDPTTYSWVKGHSKVTIDFFNLVPKDTVNGYNPTFRLIEIHLRGVGPIYLKAADVNLDSSYKYDYPLVFTADESVVNDGNITKIYGIDTYNYVEGDIKGNIEVLNKYTTGDGYAPFAPLRYDIRTKGSSYMYYALYNTQNTYGISITLETLREIEKIHVIPGHGYNYFKSGDVRIKYNNRKDPIVIENAFNITDLTAYENKTSTEAEIDVNEFVINVNEVDPDPMYGVV